jgi:hypothetical protein
VASHPSTRQQERPRSWLHLAHPFLPSSWSLIHYKALTPCLRVKVSNPRYLHSGCQTELSAQCDLPVVVIASPAQCDLHPVAIASPAQPLPSLRPTAHLPHPTPTAQPLPSLKPTTHAPSPTAASPPLWMHPLQNQRPP